MFRPFWVSHSLSSASDCVPSTPAKEGWSLHHDVAEERSPPSSPHLLKREHNDQVLRHVSLLSGSIMQLSHKAQLHGLSLDERVSLESQLASLESCISHVNAPLNRLSSPSTNDHQILEAVPHPGVMIKAHKKRAKRTFNRACVHCGTQFTSQWRKGPAGASTLCNACGIRYARRLKKDAKAQTEAAKGTPSAAAIKSHDDSTRRSNVYALLN
jgi:phage terminase large subunit GpA-like protein